MKITALRLFNVKRFAARGVAIEGIGDGVNVLCAANEFGKSTSFEALHALFFQPHSGTPGAVQALRPYSAGSPLVEADIETADGRFRITKQYYGGRSARVSDIASGSLVAQADEAENFIAELVKGGTAGPAGLLWVRQGVTGIEQRSRSEEDREKQVRASLLESVQGEVEAVTGGRRMADIMARTQGALSELITPGGKPKGGGRYDAAIRERDTIAEREKKLGADVSALRGFLDQRATAIKSLSEIDREDDRLQQQKAIEKAQTDFDNAKANSEQQRAAEAEFRLAREQRDRADANLKTVRAALSTSDQLRTDSEAAERLLGEIVARQSIVAKTIDTARKSADAAEKEEQDARSLLARLDAAVRSREAAERLGELVETLGKAEAVQRKIEDDEARLVHLKMPPKAVDELRALEISIAKERAIAEAAQPSAAITYEARTSARVTMDGSALNDGEPRGYDTMAELVLPGVGTIVLRSNRPAGNTDRLQSAQARHQTLLASMGVTDLAAARAREVHTEEVASEINALKRELSVLAPKGLPKLRETVAALQPTGEDAQEPTSDPEAVRSALVEAEKRRQEARETAQAAEPLRQRANDAFVAARESLAGLRTENLQVSAILGPEAERATRESSLVKTLRENEDQFEKANTKVERLEAQSVDLASVEGALRRHKSVAEAGAKRIQTLRDAIVEVTAQISARSEDAVEESWRESVEALDAAESRVKAYEHEVAVLQRLSSVLDAARSQARELYLKPVMAELGPLLGLLFNDVSIVFDEKTLLPQTISRNGLQEDVDRLSGGMREQLSVLTRLAFARLLAKDGRPAPVILDDALVYSDDDRIEKMFDALHRQSSDQQIIVFSCRQRAFQKLGGNILTMTDWQP